MTRKASSDYNLKVVKPQLAKEWDYKKNKLKPQEVTPNSRTEIWWKCKKNHNFKRTVDSRTKNGKITSCPYCSNKIASKENSIYFTHKELVKKHWDFEKNIIDPKTIVPGSGKEVWWICTNGHSIKHPIRRFIARKSLGSCKYCSKASNFTDIYPDLKKEWDYKRNRINPTSNNISWQNYYWWICPKNHSYKSRLNHRAYSHSDCPYCVGQKIGYGNDLLTKFPKIASEWDFKKNKLKPEKVTPGSKMKVWWICSKNHSWSASIAGRAGLKTGCPYCSGLYASKENNFKKSYPELSKQWDYKRNKKKPQEFTPTSGYKVWWVCPTGHSYNSLISSKVRSYNKLGINSGCPYCKITPRSREEIFLLFELKKFFNINEDNHKVKLNKVVDVDIKIGKQKIIIEYDGAYWHKDKGEQDKLKTQQLTKAGWTVLRVREKPLKLLSKKYNVSINPGEIKIASNKVLEKLSSLGFKIEGLEEYKKRKTLQNKKLAEAYISKLMKNKASVS